MSYKGKKRAYTKGILSEQKGGGCLWQVRWNFEI